MVEIHWGQPKRKRQIQVGSGKFAISTNNYLYSEKVQDRRIISVKSEQEVVRTLSDGHITLPGYR